MSIRLGAREARNKFADLLGRVGYGGEVVVVERSGKAMAVMVPVELYEHFLAERESHFAIVDQVQNRNYRVSELEVSKEVDVAIMVLRGDHASSGS